jgi:hypothetical protein
MGKTAFINVYKMLRNSPNCLDKKNLILHDGNNIDPCFHLKRKLSPLLAKRVVEIFLNRNSYGKPDPNCFSTDYAMILFDKEKKNIGTITMSLICNNLSFNNRPPIKLTNKAKNELVKIIR